MLRTLFAAATVATLAVAFVPSSASACGSDGDCPCNHAKMEQGADKQATPVKADAKAADKKAKKAVVKEDAAKEPAAKPVEHTSVMDEVDQIIAAKCSCSSQADCTCKKGECKCSKCNGHMKVRMIESLRGNQDSSELPLNARYDATAGIFI